MWKSAGRAPSLRVFTLAFVLQLRKKHGKTAIRVRETSVRLIKTSVRVQYTYYQDTHTLKNRHKHTIVTIMQTGIITKIILYVIIILIGIFTSILYRLFYFSFQVYLMCRFGELCNVTVCQTM
jgi:hypothetical protein